MATDDMQILVSLKYDKTSDALIKKELANFQKEMEAKMKLKMSTDTKEVLNNEKLISQAKERTAIAEQRRADMAIAQNRRAMADEMKNMETVAVRQQRLQAEQLKANERNAKQAMDMETKVQTFKEQQFRNLQNARRGSLSGAYDTEQLKEFENKVRNISASTPNASNRMRELNSEFATMRTNAKLTSVEMNNSSTALQNLTSDMVHNLSKMGEWLIAGTVLMTVIHGIGDAFNFTIEQAKMFTTLQMELTNQTLVYSEVIKKSNEYAESVGSTTSAISQAVGIFSTYTTSLDEAMQKSKSAAVLSNISSENVEQAADNIQAAMEQFKMGADDAEKVVDIYAGTARNLSVDYQKAIKELAGGTKIVGAVAEAQGVSIERTAAMVGTLIEKTRQSGNQAATGLKTIFSRMSRFGEETNPEDFVKLEKALHGIGVEMKNVKDGSMIPTDIVLGNLAKKWDTLTDAQKNNFSDMAAGVHQRNKFLVLMSNWADVEKNTEAAINSQGVAAQKNQIFMDSYQGSINKFKNEMEKLYISVLSPDNLKTWVDLGTGIAEFTNNVGLANIAVGALVATMYGLGTFQVIAGWLGTLTMALAGVTTGTLSFRNALIALGATAEGLAAIPLIAVITAVAGGFIYATQKAKEYADAQGLIAEKSQLATKQMYDNQEAAKKSLTAIADLAGVKKLNADQDARVQSAMIQLQKLYPNILNNLDKEKDKVTALVGAYNAVAKAALRAQVSKSVAEEADIVRLMAEEESSRGPQGLAVDSGKMKAPETVRSKALSARLKAVRDASYKAKQDYSGYKDITAKDLLGTKPTGTPSPDDTKPSSLAKEQFTTPEKLAKDRYFLLNQELEKYNVLLAENSALQENATDLAEKNALYQKEIKYLGQKKDAIKAIQNEQRKEQAELKNQLKGKGVVNELDYNKQLNSLVDKLNATRSKGDKETHDKLLVRKTQLEDIYSRYVKITGAISDNEIAQYKLTGEIGKTKEEITKLFDAEIKRIESLRKTAIDSFKDSLSEAVDKIKDLSDASDSAFEKDIESKKKAIEVTKEQNDILDDQIERQKLLDDLAQKELIRNNISAQKNVRFLNATGDQFTWISDPDALKKADEDISDAKQKLVDHDLDSSRKAIEREKQAEITAVEEKRKANKEYYDGKIKEMQDSSAQIIKDMENGNTIQSDSMTKFYDDMRKLDKKYADDKIATMQNAMSQINSFTGQISAVSGSSSSGSTPISSSTVEAAGGMRDYLKSQGWSDSGIKAAGYKDGGVDTNGGLQLLHGTPNAPEVISNPSQIMNLATRLGIKGSLPQMANQMHNMSNSSISTPSKSIGDIIINSMTVSGAESPQNWVNQLQQIRITHS